MQAVKTTSPTVSAAPGEGVRLTVSVELLAILLVIGLALLLRLAELDSVPMNTYEAARSLGAVQAVLPDTPGDVNAPASPLLFFLQTMAFSVFGVNEFSARLGSVIGGIVLLLMPYWLRPLIGRDRAFIWMLLLVTSPVVFATSRMADALIWTVVFALLLVGLVYRAWMIRSTGWAIAAVVVLTLLILLSHPGGVVLALVLAVAGVLTVYLTAWNAADELDEPGDAVLAQVRGWLLSLPWLTGLGISLLIVFSMATLFMLYPAGGAHVGHLVGAALAGLAMPSDAGLPWGAGLVGLVVHELLLIILALVAAWNLFRQRRMNAVRRFWLAWAGLGALVLLVYRGATPAYAIWVVVPLAALASDLVAGLFVNRPVALFWRDELISPQDSAVRYAWVKWVIGLLVVSLLIVMGVHLQEVARGFVRFPPDASALGLLLNDPSLVTVRYSLIWLVMLILIAFVGLMLIASIWGNRTTLQGLGLGVVFFLLGNGIGGGWNIAVINATNPAEYWYATVTSPDAYLLRETLFEVSQRDTAGFPEIAITVVEDDRQIQSEALVGWLLRNYADSVYVNAIEEARQQEIILMPEPATESPDLGGDYVGQAFTLGRPMTANSVSLLDLIAWWGQRQIRPVDVRWDVAVLWLRQDVYDAVPVQDRVNAGLR